MIKESFVAVGSSARDLLRGRGGLAVINALYAALLVCLYMFFAQGVATGGQLAVSALTALLAPLLFFVLQAAVAHFAQGTTAAGALLKRALRDFWKIVVVSLPLVALAVGIGYLLYKLEGRLPTPDEPGRVTFGPPRTGPPSPLHWQDLLTSSLWLLVLGCVLPLAAAQAWLSVARDGLKATLKRSHRLFGRAFAPRPLLVYAVGLVVFGLMPYFIIFTRTPVSAAWGEFALFGLRLALAFVFTLWGWTITLGALARTAPPPTAEAASEPAAAEPPNAEEQLVHEQAA